MLDLNFTKSYLIVDFFPRERQATVCKIFKVPGNFRNFQLLQGPDDPYWNEDRPALPAFHGHESQIPVLGSVVRQL